MKVRMLTLGISLFDKLPEIKFVGQDWAMREWSWGIADKLWFIRAEEKRRNELKTFSKELV